MINEEEVLEKIDLIKIRLKQIRYGELCVLQYCINKEVEEREVGFEYGRYLRDKE